MDISGLDPTTLSRLQFGITALYHFLFVPLTLGLAWLLFILEATYVMSGKKIWKDATQFWGKLFGINFAMGIATGITLEFQFGTNWSYYSHYVGDIFGVPLALEGMMAFFLESSFVGLFFFGWKRLSRVQHLTCTFLVALGSNFSALWILIANGWMQNPVGSHFNPETMRMELSSFYDIIFNPIAQAKFVHTLSAGYVCGAIFMLAISSYFLLKQRHIEMMKRSFTVAAAFGLLSIFSVLILGDESGYELTENQKMKLAAIESLWDSAPPLAPITLFGIPDQKQEKTLYDIRIPYVLGLIATRSFDTPIAGIKELRQRGVGHIKEGIIGYHALKILEEDPYNKTARETLHAHEKKLGYALLLKANKIDPLTASDADIEKGSYFLVPQVAPLFWSFRLMVASGLLMLALFIVSFFYATKRVFNKTWLLKAAFYSLPLPWIASECGWIVAEYGRQPWVIEGVLPTKLAASALSSGQVLTSLCAFILFYTILLIIDVSLLVKIIRKGPAS
jgi:cytochrome bd ubiquinol oxidase subunit I